MKRFKFELNNSCPSIRDIQIQIAVVTRQHNNITSRNKDGIQPKGLLSFDSTISQQFDVFSSSSLSIEIILLTESFCFSWQKQLPQLNGFEKVRVFSLHFSPHGGFILIWSRCLFAIDCINYNSWLSNLIFFCTWAFLEYSQSLLDLRSSSSIDLKRRDEGKSAAFFSFKSLLCYYMLFCGHPTDESVAGLEWRLYC